MAFRFNFSNPAINSEICNNDTELTLNNEDSLWTNQVASMVFPSDDDQWFKDSESDASIIQIGHYKIKHFSSSSLLKRLKEGTENGCLLVSEEKQSDLLPGVYEGGLKIWECALDLANFICEKTFLPKTEVLELGCGAGIPGLVAYLCGCNIAFQDFNPEVLKLVTIPNVLLNTPNENRAKVLERCSFIAGDWKAIQNEYFECNSTKKLYNIILTSETIYEKQNHQKLLDLMKCSLAPNGTIYLAAKVHYFGVGGSLDEFQHLVNKDNTFEHHVVYSTEGGVERKIIEMRFLKKKSCN